MFLSIVSPEKELYNGDVESVTLPGVMGEFTIWPHHAPIVSSLKAGKVFYRLQGANEVQTVDIDGGFVEQSNDRIDVCVELAAPIKLKQ
ncbi:MAG: ATP synthase F1 subunit epsilon [Mediterranea sp.]|jgi:F-type H+-transporting ATPase subunit epsilon|nr:ATP synthase F1 subunit epsilon [Mediterranea sp.]